MASGRVPQKVKRQKAKGANVEFDGKTWRVNGHKLDRMQRGKPVYLAVRS
jgi:hypothetical protein